MSKVIARELQREQFPIDHGTYDYIQLTQQTGGQSLAAITNGGDQSIFEFPPGVYNLSKTICNYDCTPAAGIHFNLLSADTPVEIQQLYMYTRTNVQMLQLQDANTYVNTTLRYETQLEEMLDNDQAQTDLAGPPVAPVGIWQGLQAPHVAIDPTAAAGVPTVVNQLVPVLGAQNTVPSLNTPAYYIASRDVAAGPLVRRKFPLSIFKNTILSLDQDIYFPETVYLKIVWESARNVYYNVTALGNSSTGAAFGTAYGYSNLTLYAAVEKNPVICNDLARAAESGSLKYLVPYVYTDIIGIGGGTNQNIQTRYNRGHGSRLKTIYWAPYSNAPGNGRTIYDHSNVGGSKVTSFYTTINTARTNTFNYDVTKMDDFSRNSQLIKGSAITNSTDYYTNWVWIENFCNNYNFIDDPQVPPEQQYVDGLDLTAEKIYLINSITVDAAYTHYVFAICQRELSIAPGMITIG